jgi:hypothetical protein
MRWRPGGACYIIPEPNRESNQRIAAPHGVSREHGSENAACHANVAILSAAFNPAGRFAAMTGPPPGR